MGFEPIHVYFNAGWFQISFRYPESFG